MIFLIIVTEKFINILFFNALNNNKMINTIFNIAVVLSVFYFLTIFISKVFDSQKDEKVIVRDNVLLVIAHPDDECMYVYY